MVAALPVHPAHQAVSHQRSRRHLRVVDEFGSRRLARPRPPGSPRSREAAGRRDSPAQIDRSAPRIAWSTMSVSGRRCSSYGLWATYPQAGLTRGRKRREALRPGLFDPRGVLRRAFEDGVRVEALLATPPPMSRFSRAVVQQRAEEPSLDVGDDRSGDERVGVAPRFGVLASHRVLRSPVHPAEDGGRAVDHHVFLVEPPLELLASAVHELSAPVRIASGRCSGAGTGGHSR